MRTFLFLTLMLLQSTVFAQNVGYAARVLDEQGSPVFGAVFIIKDTKLFKVTDTEGRIQLYLSEGRYSIEIKHMGFATLTDTITISRQNNRVEHQYIMLPIEIEQRMVTITSERDENSTVLRKLEREDIRKMPNLFSDALRSIQILPGVTSNNETSGSYNVRGGNLNENLMYINGFEIYRPFLLRQGIEESASLVNGDLVESFMFYGGAFPAQFGDRLSSALEVHYSLRNEEGIDGIARIDVLNVGAATRIKTGNLKISAGARYAYPALFSTTLHTKGSYAPSYSDFQIYANYRVSSTLSISALALEAYNLFDLTPESWAGHFQTGRFEVKEIFIDYSGTKKYSYRNSLYGVRATSIISPQSSLTLSLSTFASQENDDMKLRGDIYYSEDAYNPEDNRLYLKTRNEFADNTVSLRNYDASATYAYDGDWATILLGGYIRFTNLDASTNETTDEVGTSTVLEESYSKQYTLQNNNGYHGVFVSLERELSDQFRLRTGLRSFFYSYNDEVKVSPRATLFYTPNALNTLNLSVGYYYQPPFYYELLQKENKVLISQEALHIMAGWERRSGNEHKWQFEAYYKLMSNLLPFYMDQLRLVYQPTNKLEAFAAGFDIQYQGELVEGIKSWIGYGYISSGEREKGSLTPYRGRVLQQSHTLKIFLQDRLPKRPEFQAHIRTIVGSGFSNHPKNPVLNPDTDKYQLITDLNVLEAMPFYFRVDMGLTWEFKMSPANRLLVSVEVLNVFDKRNTASYNYYQVFPETPDAVRVPMMFTRRFFNLGAEITL